MKEQSDMQTSSEELEDLDLGLNVLGKVSHTGKIVDVKGVSSTLHCQRTNNVPHITILKKHRANEIRNHGQIVPTLTESHQHKGGANPPIVLESNVPSTATTTSSQSKPTTKTSEKTISQQTLEPLKQIPFQTLICCVEDTPVKVSLLQVNERGLTTQEELSSSKLKELLEKNNQKLSFLKMSRGFLAITKDILSRL